MPRKRGKLDWKNKEGERKINRPMRMKGIRSKGMKKETDRQGYKEKQGTGRGDGK